MATMEPAAQLKANLEILNFRKKIRNQQQEINTYQYQNRLLTDRITALTKTIESFKKLHNINKKSDRITEQVLQEELIHKIEENSNLHKKLEEVHADFQKKEIDLLRQVDEISVGYTIQQPVKQGIGDSNHCAKEPQKVDPPQARPAPAKNTILFDYTRFCEHVQLVLPNFKLPTPDLNEFHPGCLLHLLTTPTSQNIPSAPTLSDYLIKALGNCNLTSDYLNDRQRQVAHNDEQNDAIVRALEKTNQISTSIGSLGAQLEGGLHILEFSKELEKLSLNVSLFMQDLAVLEIEDFNLARNIDPQKWDLCLKRLIQQRIGLQQVSDMLRIACADLQSQGIVKTDPIWTKKVAPNFAMVESEVQKEIAEQFCRKVDEGVAHLKVRMTALDDALNSTKGGFTPEEHYLMKAEKVFWEQEANSLANRLEGEISRTVDATKRSTKAELTSKLLKEEMRYIKKDFEGKLVQFKDEVSILQQKLDPHNSSLGDRTRRAKPATANGAKVTVSKAPTAQKRPVLLSNIFK